MFALQNEDILSIKSIFFYFPDLKILAGKVLTFKSQTEMSVLIFVLSSSFEIVCYSPYNYYNMVINCICHAEMTLEDGKAVLERLLPFFL